MKVRTATKEDLLRILALGQTFGHQMSYQKDPTLMEKYLSRILVTEEPVLKDDGSNALDSKYVGSQVVGFYHYIVSTDPGFAEMLRCYRQMPEYIIDQAIRIHKDTSIGDSGLCVIMQGGCHRDAFVEMVKYLQTYYSEIWCWNSITDPKAPSSKIQGYKDLGFRYKPGDQSKFFNVHKGDFSTYCLGRWIRPN